MKSCTASDVVADLEIKTFLALTAFYAYIFL